VKNLLKIFVVLYKVVRYGGNYWLDERKR